MDSGMSVSPVAADGATVAATVPPNKGSAPSKAFPLPAILWFLALLIVLFLPVIKPMVTEWVVDEDMGYAFFVPLVAGYIVWLDRDKILATPVKPCWPALALVVWAFLQMLIGFLGAIFFVQETAFVVAIIGVIWTVGGTAVLRKVLFPALLLLFMIKIPLFIYQQMTIPLQSLAAQVATWGLQTIGIPVWREGNVLNLASKPLEVVEACSGIRSLLSLAFLAIAYGRLFESRMWVRLTLLVSTVPIAIICNSARITLTGILTEYKPEIAEGAYHAFEGWVIFMFELVVLLSFHRLLTRFGKHKDA
jgi:exosortase